VRGIVRDDARTGASAAPRARGVARPRTGFVALLLVVLAGCAFELAYDNVPRLARWFAGEFIDMDDAQEARFDAGVREAWDWHRKNHLPRYADLLDDLPRRFADGAEPAEIAAIIVTVYAWAFEIEERVQPMSIELLASLSDAQVGKLERQLRKSNEELAKDERNRSLEENRREWHKQTASRFSNFSGRLNDAQNVYLAEQSVRYLPDTVLWVEYRSRWQADLLELLALRADREHFAEGFRQLAKHRERYYGAELTQVWKNNEALAADSTAWLINSLTPAQRDRFYERLAEFSGELRTIAGGGDPGNLSGAVCSVVDAC
jgi:hypothetical protein